jgi:hypothetical protein
MKLYPLILAAQQRPYDADKYFQPANLTDDQLFRFGIAAIPPANSGSAAAACTAASCGRFEDVGTMTLHIIFMH